MVTCYPWTGGGGEAAIINLIWVEDNTIDDPGLHWRYLLIRPSSHGVKTQDCPPRSNGRNTLRSVGVSFIISLCVVSVSIGCTCSVVLRTPAALQDKQTLQALSDCGCSSFTVSLLHHPAHHSPSSLAAVPVFTAECICREIRRLSLCLPSPPQPARAGAGRSVRWSNTSHNLQPGWDV